MQDPLVGTVVDGRYEIQSRIGEGGMGVVYKARQLSIDRVVAIKMLSQEMAKDPNWVKRFNQEGKACSRLQHPNTIRMIDFGQTREGRLYLAMEFLDGKALRQAIAEGAPMAAVRVLKILIQCCASLTEAHSYGIIHRDIKPDNVFLLNLAGSPDFVKLLDFSVAKLLQENDAMRTQAGVVFGTPQYMSPEQGRGAPLDPRSDIYALGILAYEMLTGRVPFTDENPMNVLQMHMRTPPPALPPAVQHDVRDIVLRALEKDPRKRYQAANEMMMHCQAVFTGLGAGAMNQGAPPPGPTPDSEATVMAPVGGPMGVPPPSAPQWGGAAASGGPAPAGPPPAATADAAQKTMIAQDASALLGQLHQQQPPAGFGGNPPEVKTVMASDPSALGFGVPGAGMAPPAAAQAPAPAPAPDLSDGAPKKTMILDSSEGVVSFAASGGSAAPAAVPAGAAQDLSESTSVTDTGGGASAVFWIVCLLTGLGVGVLAYIVVLQLG